MQQIFDFLLSPQVLGSLITILACTLVYTIFCRITKRLVSRRTAITKKKRTLLRLINNIAKYALILLAVAIILELNGVDVTSLVAGLGIASVIAGLALQDALKDVIMGVNIIVDDYFSVGDYVRIGTVEGKVVEVGLKATRLRDANNNIHVISNRSITDSTVLSDFLDIDLSLPYEEGLAKVEPVLKEITDKAAKLDKVKSAEYLDISLFSASSIDYRLRLHVAGEFQPTVKRQTQRIIKEVLDARQLSIPYEHVQLIK